ncbi:MAG: carboxymuconolactone decarboxylase family protein [Steroidobacteraceae bacterium]|jgi:alkylhydroperoxidase family enzyme|nr:carboxymuconolactone decarboxylase family protein [Steroidobacteraceae bacterium]
MADTLFTRIPRDQLPEQFHLAWDTLNGLTGEPTFVEVFAQNPEMLDFVMNKFYGPVFFGGQVDNRYKQLARLKLSLVHGCRTCNQQNVPGALAAGIAQAQVDAMDDFENGPFTDAEKAVIAYAGEVALTNPGGEMTPALFQRLRRYFSEADILELGTAMAIISGMAKLSFVLNLVEKETYCPFVPRASAAA